jgi:DNA-binding NtrC family response regulator
MAARVRVVCISQEAALLLTRQWLLEREDFVVHSLENGSYLAGAAETHGPFDLAILGHSMPAAERKAAAVWLRANQPSTKILLLGNDAAGLEKPDFDDMVDPSHGPAKFVEMAIRLTDARSVSNPAWSSNTNLLI